MPASGDAGFVNAYEQSKREAEALVLGAGLDAVVLRTSTLACDGRTGQVVQLNALHRALWLTFNGLVPMLPGSDQTPVDVIPHDWAARAVARLAALAPSGSVLHLCAGRAAPTLGALLDATLALLRAAPEFRRRTVARPDLVDPATWALFSRTVFETGDRRLAKILRGLESFVPQLSLPKRFETARAEALLGEAAPPVEQWWPRMIGWLLETRWRDVRAEEAA
jgi:nucleoside-diphosphate-sugar epimerase